MHTTQRERVWAAGLVGRSPVKRWICFIYIGQFFQVFVFRQAKYVVSFSRPDLPWGPSGVHTHPSAKMDLKVKASGRSKTHYGLELSPGF